MVRARTVAAGGRHARVLLPAPAAAVDEACTTQGYGGAERVVTTPKPSGYQVTAVYGEGVYRASRCDKSGDLIEGQTVAPIAEPDGDVALVPSTYSSPRGDGSVLYGDPRDPVWARAWAAERRAGQGRRHRAAAGRGRRDARPSRRRCSAAPRRRPRGSRRAPRRAPTPAATGRSSATARSPAGRRGATPTASTGGRSATTPRPAARSWPGTRTGTTPATTAASPIARTSSRGYIGLTTRTARSRARRRQRRRPRRDREHHPLRQLDGRHRLLVGAARPGHGPVHRERHALRRRLHVHEPAASSAARTTTGTSRRTRPATASAWTTQRASPWLTMYPQATQSSTFWRTLALGDVFGMRNIYP